jgi:predicted DCC family thiol-disulfide oxidoreductase YuxK
MSPADSASRDLTVVYDGDCPFCSSFVLLYRLREQGRKVELIDARSGGPIVEEIHRRNLDLDRGMVVMMDGRLYHGAAAMNLLAILGSGETLFNRLNRLLFLHPNWARRLYPLLVRGRLITLRLLGRSLIGEV